MKLGNYNVVKLDSSLYFKLHGVTTSMNTTITLGKLALLMTISVVFVLALFVFFIFACASVGIAVWFLISAISVIIVIGLLSGFFVSSVTREAGGYIAFSKKSRQRARAARRYPRKYWANAPKRT